ncbi:MAG: hypothetical protein WC358_00445 [Ignavibacteria bacterium]|jgi:hypothetical protein
MITNRIILPILAFELTLIFLSTISFGQTTKDRKFTDNQWLSDLDSMVFFMKKTHPGLYWKTPEETFNNQVNQIKGEIPRLSDNEIITRFCNLVSLVKDGHTLFMGSNISEKYFPVRIESFSDGHFITAVSKQYADLYGVRVLKIGNYSSAEVFKKIGTVTSGDNSNSELYWSSRNLTMNSLLNGLGIISALDLLTLEIINKNNEIKTFSIKAENYPFKDDPYYNWFWHDNAVPDKNYLNLVSACSDNPPLRLKTFEKPYWFEYIEEQKALYFCFNRCENDSKKPFSDFIKNLWNTVETKKPEKLIIDLRNNLGGTNSYLQPLIHGIIRHDEINKSGHLFVMISRKTFSAAMHCATWIERNAQPIFVGEPTGAAPNHYADPKIYELPNSKLLLFVSTTWWQNGLPWDKREWIEPELKVEVDSKEYFNGEDKALEKIFNFIMKQ